MRAVVVGAGMAGAFAADTLRRRLGTELDLHVLEQEVRVGGRAYRREIAGVDVETGASLYHSSNRLIADAARELGLGTYEANIGGTFGIWDGNDLVLHTKGRGRLDDVQILTRYGRSMLAARREVSRLVRKLEQVYPRLERGEAWDGPEAMLRDLDLYTATQTVADHLADDRFRSEFVDAVSRNNYAQDARQLSMFAELVSLAGAGLGGGRLLRVAEGNGVVADALILRSRARLQIAAAVRRIEPTADGWRLSGTGFDPLDADLIILAAPLELAAVEIVGVAPPAPRTYAEVHVTFVDGALRPRSVGAERRAPSVVLTTAEAGDLLSIERVAITDAGALHKVFSRSALADDDIEAHFLATSVVRMRWAAYPLLSPRRDWSGFCLAPGLFTPSAMEYAISTMETQAIAGVATANLAATRSSGRRPAV